MTSADDHVAHDLIGTIHAVAPIVGWVEEGLGDAPGPDAVARFRAALGPLLDTLGIDPGAATADPPAAIRARAPQLATTVRDLPTEETARLLATIDADLRGAGRAVADVALPGGPGRVAGLHRSDGGVPKLPVTAAVVGPRGLAGDHQAARRHHGKPMQALCLYATEVIEALRAEGHPISPGAAGENVTVAGLAWPALRPLVRLRIGEVLAELSAPATPCAKNSQWFVAGEHDRMSHDLHPGWSRWYAWVLEPGRVTTGDAVTVEP